MGQSVFANAEEEEKKSLDFFSGNILTNEVNLRCEFSQLKTFTNSESLKKGGGRVMGHLVYRFALYFQTN